MSVSAPPLLPLLRSRVQGDVLAWTYLHPDAEYSLTDLSRLVGASIRAVHHEVDRLSANGLLLERRLGNLRLVRSATDTVVGAADLDELDAAGSRAESRLLRPDDPFLVSLRQRPLVPLALRGDLGDSAAADATTQPPWPARGDATIRTPG